ncbi:MAG: hypothetical protein EXQ86_11065 [Rhodospirillales bacterium]|nr:hypothetical protein [Rhodospirillales bacterium]
MDPINRIKDLIVITGRLSELLRRENKALRDRRSDALKTLLEEKSTLGRVYETRLQGLIDDEVNFSEIDPGLREQLREAADQVREMMDENAKLLKVAIAANKRVVDMIAMAVKRSMPTAGTYSKKGAVGSDGYGAAAKRNMAFSLDRTL